MNADVADRAPRLEAAAVRALIVGRRLGVHDPVGAEMLCELKMPKPIAPLSSTPPGVFTTIFRSWT